MTPAPPPPEILKEILAWFIPDRPEPDPDRLLTEDEMRAFDEACRWVAETPDAPATLRQIIRGIPEEFYGRRWSAADLAEGIGVSEAAIIEMAERGLLRGCLGPNGWRFGPADVYALDPDEEDRA